MTLCAPGVSDEDAAREMRIASIRVQLVGLGGALASLRASAAMKSGYVPALAEQVRQIDEDMGALALGLAQEVSERSAAQVARMERYNPALPANRAT